MIRTTYNQVKSYSFGAVLRVFSYKTENRLSSDKASYRPVHVKILIMFAV